MRITVGKKTPQPLEKNILKELYIAQISSESELLKWWVVKKPIQKQAVLKSSLLNLMFCVQ